MLLVGGFKCVAWMRSPHPEDEAAEYLRSRGAIVGREARIPLGTAGDGVVVRVQFEGTPDRELAEVVSRLNKLRLLVLWNARPLPLDVFALLIQPPTIKWPSLSGCAVTDDHVAMVCERTSIKVLLIDTTEVTDQSLDRLAELRTLLRVRVVDTKVTRDGVARFRAARPDVDLETAFDGR